jgi:hypothetical protein
MSMLQTMKSRVIGAKAPADRYVKRFHRFFPKGFQDPKYFAWERGYKWEAHLGFREVLNEGSFRLLLKARKYGEIAGTSIRLESQTNLLFSFEKMAIRDAVKTNKGAKTFSEGLFELLHGGGSLDLRFQNWCDAVESLPRKQTRVLTHPVVTLFPFLADPATNIFLKPLVTKKAAERLGIEFQYASRPSWEVYSRYLDLARAVRTRLKTLKPRDMIDIQSFLWVTGSSEYE